MKWTYKTVWNNIPMTDSDLEKLGIFGWELCGVVVYARNYYYHFKKLVNE